MEVLKVVLRVTGCILAFFLLYAALFLYEDEESSLQNRLENWWIRLSYRSHEALSKHVLFMQEIFRSASNFMNRLFGQDLLSVRAISVLTCISIASALAEIDIGLYLDRDDVGRVDVRGGGYVTFSMDPKHAGL